MRRSAIILFALFLVLAATACGQKGPLKLPPETPPPAKLAPTGSGA